DGLRREGYHVHVLFLWLRSADLAVGRVAERVRLGGHDVAETVVRRRYEKGLRNFFGLYLPLANSWQAFDNSDRGAPRRIAAGAHETVNMVDDAAVWRRLTELYCG